jgi:glycosyltransferase involved in cell wall biosynthesis
MRLSIVTISYNQASFLEECISSVVSQKSEGDEYIVVDPGSTDGSRAIIANHASGIDRLVLEPDHGPADGLNKGFAQSTGEILGYINADDRFVPGALAFVRNFFALNLSADVLCGAIRIVDGRGAVSARKRTSDRFDLRRYAAGICTVGQQATFFRHRAFEAAGGFNAENGICWDGELLVDLALTGARFATVRRVLGDFRIYSTSMTGSRTFTSKLYEEHGRIAAKIAARGVRLYSERALPVHRLLYRLDLLRHVRYLLAS